MRRSRVVTGVAGLAAVTLTGAALAYGGVDLSRLGPAPTAVPTGAPPARPSATPAGPAGPPARVLLPAPAGGLPPSAAGVARMLDPLLAVPQLGPRVGAVIVDAGSGATLLDRAGDVPHTPASTAKLLTGAAALTALGPDARLATRVVRGTAPDEVVLVGGGDPTLTAADRSGPPAARLTDLARATAAALASGGPPGPVTLRFDDSLFVGPAVSPGWEPGYVASGQVSPVSALAVDAGRQRPGVELSPRYADPAAAAAAAFAAALAAAGVPVSGAPSRVAAAPASEAPELARVTSPPLSTLVERMLTDSDNDLAEALARHVARAQGWPASFDGAGQAVPAVVARLGVPVAGVRLLDGSGLSRADAVPARSLAAVLAAAAGPRPGLRSLLSGLPVAGFSGTLADRFVGAPAAGVVRAKTGTLTGVSALAGVAYDADGAVLVFVVLADRVPATGPARLALDRVAEATQSCGCP